MRKLLTKIFSGSLGAGRFFLSGIAFLLGLSLVLLSVQAYFKITTFLSPKQEISDYIVLNKEVGLGHTIFGGKVQFSEEEIKDLESQSFIADVGKFTSNHFHIELFFQGIKFTDLFLESVPPQFLEEQPYNFRWNESGNTVPLIVSEDFVNLYNVFAVGADMPQVSKSTAGLVTLKLRVSGPGGSRTFNAKVVGFSERINSVLVPPSFLEWGNKSIAKEKGPIISRVIVQVNSKESGNLESYMAENGLKISEDKLRFNRVAMVFSIVMTILFIIGTAFIIFSLVIVVMNFSLLIAEAKEEIRLLIQLGYKTGYILKHLLSYLFLFLFFVSGISLTLFFLTNQYLTEFLNSSGITASSGIEMEVWIAMLVFVLVSTGVSVYSISRVLSKHS